MVQARGKKAKRGKSAACNRSAAATTPADARGRVKSLLKLLHSQERPRCQLETMAIERAIRDLETGHKRGLWWDECEAQRAVSFFGELKHWKGEWTGQPIQLAAWQEQLIVAPLFGWKRKNRTRRFRRCYVELPRKNAKTTLTAGIGLFGLAADREGGAEIYVGATKERQAKLLFTDAKMFVKKSEGLLDLIKVRNSALVCLDLASTFQPVASNSETLDGLNAHMALLDELHAHPNGKLYNVLASSQGARSQPLIMAITTAGNNRTSFCYSQRTYAASVLRRETEDDALLPLICTIDDGDDWTTPEAAAKANPNLGISIYPDFLLEQCKVAQRLVTARDEYRQKHLNEWVSDSSKWIQPKDWTACLRPRDQWPNLEGRECFLGLDLAARRDLTAAVELYREGKGYYCVATFWLPAKRLEELIEEGDERYKPWVDAGYIRTTDTYSTDYEAIREWVRELASIRQVKEIAYDPWNASQLSGWLINDGFQLVPVAQTFPQLNEPTKELEALIVEQLLWHEGHPVLAWCADNVDLLRDASGNVKPKKPAAGGSNDESEDQKKKIDGISALVTCLKRAMLHNPKTSVYEDPDRGVIVL